MGPGRFLAFYLLCGLIAAAAHVLSQPASPVPTVGASGAISGVLGAYLVLYPSVRVNMLFIFVIFFRVFAIPAWMVLIWWFGLQVLSAYMAPSRPDESGGVAVWAHIGGFVAGMVLIKVFENPRLVAQTECHSVERMRLGCELPTWLTASARLSRQQSCQPQPVMQLPQRILRPGP